MVLYDQICRMKLSAEDPTSTLQTLQGFYPLSLVESHPVDSTHISGWNSPGEL